MKKPRPYAPDYVSAATLAYRLDIGLSTVSDHVKRGLLPPPIEISPGLRHWRWADVEAFIAARNGLDGASTDPLPSDDPFVRGLNHVASPHA